MNFPALLTVLFVGLKLTGYITWPWLWVISPILARMFLVIFVAIADELEK